MNHSRVVAGRAVSILSAVDSNPTPSASDAPDEFAAVRARMVDEQLRAPGRDIQDPRVLAAMAAVPRHEFIPEEFRDEAYEDRPVPIGYGQTISQPYIVALMTEQLQPRPEHRVLEVGTGCGYQAAVLARLVKEVRTIEIIEPLAQRAGGDLRRLGINNVFVRAGDGYRGWPEAAPFDAILVACAPEEIPPALVAQLKEGGRLIIPVGNLYMGQQLMRLEKRDGTVRQLSVMPVRFVPMTGEAMPP